MSRHNSDINTNNLLSLLDRAKERLQEKKKAEFYESLEKDSGVVPEKKTKNNLEEFDFSNVSINSSNDRASVYLLDQIAEIKELFKTQEHLIEKIQEDDINLREHKEIKHNQNDLGSVALDSMGNNPETEGSILASTLVGLNSQSEHFKAKNPKPLLGFLKREAKLRFPQRVFIKSFIWSLSL